MVLCMLLVAILAFYFYLGIDEFGSTLQTDWKFFLVTTQSFATFGWVLLSNLEIDKYLVPTNDALRRYAKQPENDAEVEMETAAGVSQFISPWRRLQQIALDVEFVPEACVKCDIMILCSHYAPAQRESDTTDSTTRALERAWLRSSSTWMGRLGYGKLPSTSNWEGYSSSFFKSPLDDETVWGATNSVGSTSLLKASAKAACLALSAIEFLVLYFRDWA